MTRADKAGLNPTINPKDIHRWVSIWARHGRDRLRTFELLSKAHGLLDGLKRLRDLLAELEDRNTPEAVALKARIPDAMHDSERALELMIDEIRRHLEANPNR